MAVLFQTCPIKAKPNPYITAANTPAGNKYSYAFPDCKTSNGFSGKETLPREAMACIFKNCFHPCEMPGEIAPDGWNNWGNAANEQTVFYAEYNNSGPGANTSQRVSWARQLTAKEAAEYTAEKIFDPVFQGQNKIKWWIDTGK